MYIVTRNDLSSGAQIAQSCHVAFQFSNEHKDITNNWIKDSNYICCLSVNNETELFSLIERAIQNNIRFSVFKEPDIEDRVTAIALEPGPISKKLCSSLKLALKY